MYIEIVKDLYTVNDLPVVYSKKLNALILADLHLGFEEEAANLGYFIPRVQLYRSLQVLSSGLKETKASLVIFAGDVKHNFSKLTRWEREELTRLFSFLKEERGVDVVIVRGNHDNFIPIVARKFNIDVIEAYEDSDILVIHGHKRVEELRKDHEVIIMGHEHPSIKLRDKLGSVIKMPCFLTAPYKNSMLVVLPAVGQYQTGTTVSLFPETYLSPILKHDIDLGSIKPYVLAEGLGVLEFPPLNMLNDLLTIF
ncbi:MAG: metallophosphoesterase [Pyrodictiaceae archaeon]